MTDNNPSWSSLSMTVLTATFEATGDCQLPQFKGSTLRGAFGHSLLAMSGHSTNRPCGMCERQRCAYGFIFEGRRAQAGRNPVLPMIICPPVQSNERYLEGDSICLRMTLIGDAVSWVPSVIWALGRMGWKGLGWGKSQWELTNVDALTASGSHSSLTDSFDCIPVITGQDVVEKWPPFDSCELRFETPVCIRRDGRVLDRIHPVTLIRRLNGRLGDLLEAFCGADIDVLNMQSINEAAEQIRTETCTFQPKSWERFSTRSGQRHSIQGIVGSMRLSNVPNQLTSLLLLGQFLHVGKSAAFGMGSYQVTPLS